MGVQAFSSMEERSKFQTNQFKTFMLQCIGQNSITTICPQAVFDGEWEVVAV